MKPRDGARRLVGGLLALVLLAGFGVAYVAAAARQQPFPHAMHAKLFPVCTGCHSGIPTGNRAAYYPDSTVCLRCHDGRTQKRVKWVTPEPLQTNLKFTHPRHAAMAGPAGPQTCVACHEKEGAPWMSVSGVVVSRCLACHAHRASQHFVDAQCTKCHVPLARSGFDEERIATLPRPADHEVSTFLASGHGQAAQANVARCAVCHTRQKCESCHVNAARNKLIAQIPVAPASMKLPPYRAHYPKPASHQSSGWLNKHGGEASVAACSTCHTRNDCAVCHTTRPPKVIAELPRRSSVAAPGVGLTRHAPASHASPTWETAHATAVAASPASCNVCHTRNYCESCHNASLPQRASFHPPDFLSRHAAEAYGRKLECSNCHNTTVFCRSCHEQAGLGTHGALSPAFHAGGPLWLLRHGQAARQGLESCASCHKQRDCLQCHSDLGAFQVNPHGPGFDPVRAEKKNGVICFACHVTDPLQEKKP